MAIPKDYQGPVLDVRITMRPQRDWIPGSIEISETIALPVGIGLLEATKRAIELIESLRERMLSKS
jgi:hypothetical protein